MAEAAADNKSLLDRNPLHGYLTSGYESAISDMNDFVPGSGKALQFLVDDLIPGAGELGRKGTMAVGGGLALVAAGGIYEGKKLYEWDKKIRSSNLAKHQKNALENAAKGVLDLETLEGEVSVKFSRFPFGVDKDGKFDSDKNVLKIDFGRLKARQDSIQEKVRQSGVPHAVILAEAESLLRASLQASGFKDIFKDLEEGEKSYMVHRYMAALEWIYEKLLKSALVPAELRPDPSLSPEFQRDKIHPYYLKPRDALLTSSRGVARDADRFVEEAKKFKASKPKLKLEAPNRVYGGLDVEVDFSDFVAGGAKSARLEAIRSLIGFKSPSDFDIETARSSFVTEFTRRGGFMEDIFNNHLNPSDAFDRLPQGQKAAYYEALSMAVYEVFLKLIDENEAAKTFFEKEGEGIYVFHKTDKEGKATDEIERITASPNYSALNEKKREEKPKKEKFPGFYVLGDALKDANKIYDQVYDKDDKVKTRDAEILGLDTMSTDDLKGKWGDLNKAMAKIYDALYTVPAGGEPPQQAEDRKKAQEKFAEIRRIISSTLETAFGMYFSDKDLKEEQKIFTSTLRIWRKYGDGSKWMRRSDYNPTANASDIENALKEAWRDKGGNLPDWFATSRNGGTDLVLEAMSRLMKMTEDKLKASARGREFGQVSAKMEQMRKIVIEAMGAQDSQVMTGEIQQIETGIKDLERITSSMSIQVEEFNNKVSRNKFVLGNSTTSAEALIQYRELISLQQATNGDNQELSAVTQKIMDAANLRNPNMRLTAQSVKQLSTYPIDDGRAAEIERKFAEVRESERQLRQSLEEQRPFNEGNMKLAAYIELQLKKHREFIRDKLNTEPLDNLLRQPNARDIGKEFMKNGISYVHQELTVPGVRYQLPDDDQREELFNAVDGYLGAPAFVGANMREKLVYLTQNLEGDGVYSVQGFGKLIDSMSILPISVGAVEIPNTREGKVMLAVYLIDVIRGALNPHPTNPGVRDTGIPLTSIQQRYVTYITSP